MREVSVHDIPKLKSQYDQAKANNAFEKITEGLELLARMNIDATAALTEVMANLPKPEPTDLKPLIDAISKPKDPQQYEFIMHRNAANILMKVTAKPL